MSTIPSLPKHRGGKPIPKLPLSVFTPPNSSTADRFPLPPSPSAVHPITVVDGQITDLQSWKESRESGYGKKCENVVLQMKGFEGIQSVKEDSAVVAVSVSVQNKNIASSVQTSSELAPLKVHLSTSVSEGSPELIEGISGALDAHLVVDVCANFASVDAGWEVLEELIGKTLGAQEEKKGKIILSNVLPPPGSFDLPIVKLMNDQSYAAYQNAIAAISLNSHVYLKFLPPIWGSSIPDASPNNLSSDAKEWKRRIKMYLGFAIEAFGCQRIIFGSAPPESSEFAPNPAAWYEIARESIAELGIEQEDIDAVFGENAKAVYSP